MTVDVQHDSDPVQHKVQHDSIVQHDHVPFSMTVDIQHDREREKDAENLLVGTPTRRGKDAEMNTETSSAQASA